MHYYTAVGCIRDFIDFINDDVEKEPQSMTMVWPILLMLDGRVLDDAKNVGHEN